MELTELGVSDWDIWEKGISTFDYHYKLGVSNLTQQIIYLYATNISAAQ